MISDEDVNKAAVAYQEYLHKSPIKNYDATFQLYAMKAALEAVGYESKTEGEK